MLHYIFTIQDSEAAAFLPPFFLHTAAMARRAFGDSVNDKGHAFSKHPDHYTLFEIGEFDDNTGLIKAYDSTHTLGNGIEYLAPWDSSAVLNIDLENDGIRKADIPLNGPSPQ